MRVLMSETQPETSGRALPYDNLNDGEDEDDDEDDGNDEDANERQLSTSVESCTQGCAVFSVSRTILYISHLVRL
jgi:hypothetical protein